MKQLLVHSCKQNLTSDLTDHTAPLPIFRVKIAAHASTSHAFPLLCMIHAETALVSRKVERWSLGGSMHTVSPVSSPDCVLHAA
uniref:Uncharacterized protein n=1 Tax=Physcomitrium patens TaxID=3218 RepID=A0A2K1IBJ8_PHYPA|nr:hypothetical protein PHYPA_030118 [Physcomitrium patens]